MSVDRLIEAIEAKKNPTVLGLDPQPEHIPPAVMEKYVAERGRTLDALCGAYEEYVTALTDALHDAVPAVKLQSACFEALGPGGMEVLQRGVRFARERGLYVIIDAKRGDIGSTAKAYSAAFLGRVALGETLLPVFDADAVTVNPYLGSDNLVPFLKDCEAYDKMIFVLCKTSNRSSADVQELMAGDRPLYRVVAEQVSRTGRHLAGRYGYLNAAIVAGATMPAAIRQLRQNHPELFFLMPGYGTQGGRGVDVAYAFDRQGRGAVVNNSRGICCAWQKDPSAAYTDAAREAALAMRDDLRKAIL
ncbi:MAG: orotidine-5'-phosphate decarboxylase [Oscillospiraceae bacterium]|jgi:orotidine-5'-phosphate decarboxylase|nr:orotidine-5'-phosphate decarboxylase [Oscillospiraceae bacterium]